MGRHNGNMNFQLKHLMREQLCVHNTITWECVLDKLQQGPQGQALHGFKVIPCLPNIDKADEPELHVQQNRPEGEFRQLSHRVCPLQLQWESGGVWKMPGFHSPPGRWHRLGMRGHGGTAASAINRKWVWLQDRCCALLASILSQQPGKRKKREKSSSDTPSRCINICNKPHFIWGFIHAFSITSYKPLTSQLSDIFDDLKQIPMTRMCSMSSLSTIPT